MIISFAISTSFCHFLPQDGHPVIQDFQIIRFLRRYNRTAGPFWKRITGWEMVGDRGTSQTVRFFNCKNKEILQLNFSEEPCHGHNLS